MGLTFVVWNPLTGAEKLPLRYGPPCYLAPHEYLELMGQVLPHPARLWHPLSAHAASWYPHRVPCSATRLTMNSCHRPLLIRVESISGLNNHVAFRRTQPRASSLLRLPRFGHWMTNSPPHHLYIVGLVLAPLAAGSNKSSYYGENIRAFGAIRAIRAIMTHFETVIGLLPAKLAWPATKKIHTRLRSSPQMP